MLAPWKIPGGDDHSLLSQKGKTKKKTKKTTILFLLHYLVLPGRAAVKGSFLPSHKEQTDCRPEGASSSKAALEPGAAASTPSVSRHGKLKLLRAQAKYWLRQNVQCFPFMSPW